MSEEKDEDFKWLIVAVVFAAVGLVGIRPFNLYVVVICEGVAAGAIIKFRDVRISMKKQSGASNIQAEQRGRGNIQTNLTSPRNSPVINRADTVIIGSNSNPSIERPIKTPKGEESKEGVEWLCNGHIQFTNNQVFPFNIIKGDVVSGHVESEQPISLEIVKAADIDHVEEGDRESYEPYWSSPKTKNYDFSWTATAKRSGYFVIFDEFEGEKDDEDEAEVTARIIIKRKTN